jgi:hypothetical protein
VLAKGLRLAGPQRLFARLTAEVAATLGLVQPLRVGRIHHATDAWPDIASRGFALIGRFRRKLLGYPTPIASNLRRLAESSPDEDKLRAARGVVVGLALSAVLWGAIGLIGWWVIAR